MTAPWSTGGWTPQPPPSRRPSLVAIAGVVALAVAANMATVVGGVWAVRDLRDALLPSPTPSASSPATSPSAGPTPSGGASPVQTRAPFTVTDEVERGVVLITGQTPNEGVAGTGMVLSADGLVVTNYHVVRSTENLTVAVASSGKEYSAELVGRDATKDVALLKLASVRGLDTITVDAEDVEIGDVVIAAGNANGQGFVTANRGNIQAMDRQIHVNSAVPEDPPQLLRGLIETDAEAAPGDSGGPMYDAELEVLGMTTAGSSEEGGDDDPTVYAVPIQTALDVVEQVRAGDESGTVVIGPKAFLGIIAQAEAEGVVVESLTTGSPAAKAGIAEGDRILTLNGQQATDRSTLSEILDGIEPGETVDVTWETDGGSERSGRVTLAASDLN